MSMDALYKFVEKDQLPSHLGGNCPYNHPDWVRDCQASHGCHGNALIAHKYPLNKILYNARRLDLSDQSSGHPASFSKYYWQFHKFILCFVKHNAGKFHE